MALEIREILIASINIAEYNPRVDLDEDDPDMQRISASLKAFGTVLPLVWNEQTGNLVGGHQRIKDYMKDGLTKVEVSVVNLSEEDEKALNVALNNSHGRNDNPKLHAILADLPDEQVAAAGYDEERLAALLVQSNDPVVTEPIEPLEPSSEKVITLVCKLADAEEFMPILDKWALRDTVKMTIE
jgi:ParB-like chromosome segregation protein Spo0J